MQSLRGHGARCSRLIGQWSQTRAASTSSSSKTTDWSASQYLKFEKERSRPARDLLAQVGLSNPQRILDLGCGPGNSTALLRERYPEAELEGMDSSPAMLDKARKTLPDVAFHQADLMTYTPKTQVDLLFSNAALHWLPNESRVGAMRRLIESQTNKNGSVFAFQVPDNYNEPSHVAMRTTAESGPWADTLRPLNPSLGPMQTPQTLYDELKPLCDQIDIWHTYYNHVLEDHQAVVEWVKGTGLRPFIDPLPKHQQTEFLERYLKTIKEVYPSSVDGKVILRYPRLFLVAVRGTK